MESADGIREVVEEVYRVESRRVLATLIRLLGDFDLAEEALHDAFVAAVQSWPENGIPARPRGWLVSTGRFKAIDRLRKQDRLDRLAATLETELEHVSAPEVGAVEDDRLRLIFTCCHPSLPPDARLALTLREVCGLTTEEIARAFLVKPATLAQRIVRAKGKIRDAGIPYEIPAEADLPGRVQAVLRVIYLLFNEGYTTSTGTGVVRTDLAAEAIRLGRLLAELLPQPEAQGLLSLMLLHHSRRAARTSSTGDLILLEDQDRTLWNQEMIQEGVFLVERALRSRRFGTYTLQAAIAAVHAEAAAAGETDWAQIVGLYDALLRFEPSPVVALNRAAAVGMRDGPEVGLREVDGVLAEGGLDDYQPAHAARAEFCRRLGRLEEAGRAYRRALALTAPGPLHRHLERRLTEVEQQLDGPGPVS